jgi:GcrA cell cycle regulator
MTQWSNDRVEKLKSLWQAGLSASQIARALGDVSRNAVIGKVHRLGLAGRASSESVNRARQPARPRSPMPSLRQVVTVVEEEPFKFEDGSSATMRTINNTMCRWPFGDPTTGTFHFCGRSPKPGSPYCEAHNQRAHQPHRKLRGAGNRPSANRQALS